jgi:hypothetical protein
MKKHLALFWYLLTFVFIFFAIELYVFLSFQQKSFLLGVIFHSHVQIPLTLIGPVIAYWFTILLLHALLAFFIFAEAYFIKKLLGLSETKYQLVGFGLFWISILTILLANQVIFTTSMYIIFFHWMSALLVNIVLYCSLAILLIAFLLALYGFAKVTWKKKPLILILLVLILAASIVGYEIIGQPKEVVSNKQPNVIIIGLDALRPDRTGQGPHGTVLTPAINQFLQSSTVFDLSITPEARTHVAWMSILTGQWPKQNGVRFDLMRLPADKSTETLSYILRQQGYETIYASDSSLFNPITPELSFDRVITPPISADVFVVGLPNDFPMANLLMNTPFGRWLFPYTVDNRDVSLTYDPDHYLVNLKRALSQENHRPIFLGIHLCLAHEPYGWIGHPYNSHLPLEQTYNKSVVRVDQQFSGLMKVLREEGLLDHSIVILMSDHGKSLEMYGDRLLERKNYQKGDHSEPNTKVLFKNLIAYKTPSGALNISFGHGTDVLSLSQYNNVLAFHSEGMGNFKKTHVPQMVSLADIKPTILNLLNIPDHTSTLPSLVPYLHGEKVQNTPRVIFAETGFTPSSFRDDKFSIMNTVVQTIDLFEVDLSDDGVLMKPSAVADLLKTNKERAIYYGDWILAVYPQPAGKSIVVLANRITKQWTDDLTSPLAKTAPIDFMVGQMKAFYGDELTL